ncbi:polysaccharide export outer membrane protein [Azorhizobium sp. AG788]|uniref:polysaccharide biosynthesis/export family protein n=1 Tax=Azorhizobium sp. AG788 TaxID=2183897 RepID=UPI00105DC35B|nr:polysaccharide biosynthesis/export family protein [Azorhizobium sp. AG788]TDT91466.1 polysaccharide export outer membrane protein [Azorhizobium sp. AG788]
MRKVSGWPLLLPAVALSLSGCESLPQVGPNAQEVVSQSVEQNTQRYEVVDIDNAVLDVVRLRAQDTLYTSFGHSGPARSPLVGVGDFVAVNIWEAGAGGLFSAPVVAGSFTTGSKTATIPDQVVKPSGTISIPYAGEVQAAGRTTEAIQDEIVKALTGKAIQPQVLVTVTKPVSSTVTVTGEVVQGARVPLTAKGDRLLDVIATAGGVRAPVNETFIQLSRGNRTVRVSMERVVSDPRENVYMQPGDVLTVVRDPQVFLAYGATGANAEVPFNSSGITLATALVKAGGLQDNRSDPSGVFVIRYEPEFIARKLRPGSPLVVPGGLTPVVYRLNLRDTNSLFVAQHFPIFNRDVIYVTNAPITDVQKAMQIFVLVSSPATTGASLYTSMK